MQPNPARKSLERWHESDTTQRWYSSVLMATPKRRNDSRRAVNARKWAPTEPHDRPHNTLEAKLKSPEKKNRAVTRKANPTLQVDARKDTTEGQL